jgi:hypothetical protein
MKPNAEMTNPETWANIVQFTQEFPQTDYWNRWRSTVCPLLDESIRRGYDCLFRAGSSMHHILFSTISHHGLRGEPHVTLRVTEEWKIEISYSTSNVHFSSPIESVVVNPDSAISLFTRYLCHLWEETVPEPIPEALRHK